MSREVLDTEVRKSLDAVRRHEKHVLMKALKEKVWAAMGPLAVGSQPTSHSGHRRRAFLAVDCARHALPVWADVWPSDHRPHGIIEDATRLIDREVEPGGSEWERLSDDQLNMDNLMTTHFLAAAAGQCAVAALRTVLSDEVFDPDVVVCDPLSNSLDNGDQDAASWAVMAIAGGTPDDPRSSAARRLVFWQWWLEDAVSSAFSQGSLAEP